MLKCIPGRPDLKGKSCLLKFVSSKLSKEEEKKKFGFIFEIERENKKKVKVV